jgi:hypothetical protein
MEVRVVATSYLVTAWPEDMADNIDAYMWSVSVTDRGHGKWAVIRGGDGGPCLGTDDEWDYEPSPSNREDDWLAAHRFDLDEALLLARDHAPRIRINGMTALECIERHRQQADRG